MTTRDLEKRLAAVEQEIARIKRGASISEEHQNHWVEKVAETFSSPEDQAAFDEATRLGRKWRQAENRRGIEGRNGAKK